MSNNGLLDIRYDFSFHIVDALNKYHFLTGERDCSRFCLLKLYYLDGLSGGSAATVHPRN